MPRYQSYLLRVWSSGRHERRQWSARLEGRQDGQHRRFTDMESLIAGLRGLLAANALDGTAAGEDTASPDPVPNQHHSATIVDGRSAERNE